MPGMLSQIEEKQKALQEKAPSRKPAWTGNLPDDEPAHPRTHAATKARGPSPMPVSKLAKLVTPKERPAPRPPASFDLEGDGAAPAEPEPELATASKKKTRRAAVPDPSGAKTVGVKLPPSVYKAAKKFQETRALPSLKDAVLALVRAGLADHERSRPVRS